MKPGEYVGADGRTYAWRMTGQAVHHTVLNPYSAWVDISVHLKYSAWVDISVHQNDLRAAGHALIALADESETEVVEFGGHHRICQRGTEMWLEVRPPSGNWEVEPNDWPILAAYRAGLAKGTP